MSIKDSNITINVKDMEKSIAFYLSIGLTLKNRWGNYYAQITAPGLTIGLHPAKDENLTGGSGNLSIGFTTDNIEDTKAMLKKLSRVIPSSTKKDPSGS